MVLTGCFSITRPVIPLASLSSHSSNSTNPRKSSRIRIPAPQPEQTKPRQPSIVEIEQAIGAGIFRDRDPPSDPAEKSMLDVVLSNSIGKTEGPTERALREAGEWISVKTERAARSSGKRILEVMFFWMAPAWFLLLLVATGALKLPFSFPALENLIM